MSDDRITIRVEGSWPTVEEFKSLTGTFPGLSVKDGPRILYNAIGEGPARWIELGGSIANIAGVLALFLKKKPKKPLKPRNLIFHTREGETLILQRPTKKEMQEVFKLLNRTTDISLIDPGEAPELEPLANEPGEITGLKPPEKKTPPEPN